MAATSTSCGSAASDAALAAPGPLSGKRIGILVEFNYEDLELWYPKLRFVEDGADVFVIGKSTDLTFKGKHSYPCRADRNIDDVTAADMDALVIPGGFAPDYWRRDPRFCKLVADCVAANKPTGAICHGPWLMASADVLRGRRATCFCSINDDVRNAGATVVDEAVVVDGPVITSRTPKDLPQFCMAMTAEVLARC